MKEKIAVTESTAEAPDDTDADAPNTRVYRYGLLPPTVASDEVHQQLRLAHRYRNTLVEIERARRNAIHALVSAEPSVKAPEAAFEVAELALESALRAAGAAKSTDRAGVAPEPLRAAVVAARTVHRDAAQALCTARRAVQKLPHLETAIDLIAERTNALQRNARKHCAPFWGSYLLVEAAHRQACAMPLYGSRARLCPDTGKLNSPWFVRWEGEGRVGMQLQQQAPKLVNGKLRKGKPPLTVDALMTGTDTRVRVSAGALPRHADPTSKRSAKRRHCVLWLCIGSDGPRKPRFACWPMIMHRPLPEGAHIKNVTVQVRRIGPREEWSALFTVTLAAAQGRTSCDSTTATPSGRVAIDVGWRIVPEGLRVAAWRDEAGNTGTLVLDNGHAVLSDDAPRGKGAQRSFNRRAAGILGQFRKADDLQAIRKTNFNDARRHLLTQHLPALGATMPQWLREATRFLALWKSQQKLAALARCWHDARFDGDTAAYDALEAWRYHDHHLWEWETSQRTKTLRYRRELYRCFAADLATRYKTVVLEAFDLRKVAKQLPLEADETANETARGMRVIASTSELRGCLLNAFNGRGGTIEFVNPALTTKTCAACGSVEQWDQAKELRHSCGSCKAEWDQDDNASANILTWPKRTEPSKKKRKEDPAHPGETSWARAKRMSAEKKARRVVAAAAAAEPTAAE
jgi:hypothetical protein